MYDAAGNVIRQQSGDTYTYSVYDTNGELTLSATLKADYEGDPPAAYDASLTCFDTVTYTYDRGLLTKSVDSKANETVVYVYGKYGNTAKTTSSKTEDGETTVTATDYTYDLFGNVLTSTSGEEKSSYIYDAAGRTLLANEKGECTRTLYDNLGRTIQQIEPQDYDASKDGLPSKNTYADPKAGHTYVYAENGTLTSETNRLGKTTTYKYNSKGNKVQETYDIYQFTYYDHGELMAVTVAGEIKVLYLYDKDYNLMNEAYTNRQSVQYKYDADGNLTGQYKNNSTTPYITYSYNEDGDLTEKTDTDTGLRYEYGEDGSISVYKTANNSLLYSYVEQQPAEEDESTSSEDDEVTTVTETHFGQLYTYETKEKSVTYTAGSKAIYTYGTTGSDDDEKILLDVVGETGKMVLMSGYQHDSNKNITKKTTAGVKGASFNNSFVFENTYDNKNRITSAKTQDDIVYYTYDASGQLVRADDSGTGITTLYSYDERGNLLAKNEYAYTRETPGTLQNSVTLSYASSDWLDQLTNVNGKALTYDKIGNVLTYGDRTFTWDKVRQLSSVSDTDLQVDYTYDDSGIRTSKTVNGVTTQYNTKDGVILAQSDGENTLYFQYDTNGVPFGFVWNNTQYFYITNQMGDVIGITDDSGHLLVQYHYDAWGKLLFTTLTDANDQTQQQLAALNPLLYRGYYYDFETGYYYLQSRYYDPNLCRFINSDVFGISSITKDTNVGSNLFAYCGNNPVNDKDPTGHFSKKDIGNVFTKIINAMKKTCDYLLKRYGVSSKKYRKTTKYKTPSSIYKYVNQNKSKIKRLKNNISSIATFLNIVITVVEVGSILNRNKSTARAVAEIFFEGFIKLIAYAATKLVTFIVSNILQARLLLKYVLNFIFEELIDLAFSGKWVNRLKKYYLSYVTSYSISFSNYFKALFRGAKKLII